MKEGKRKLNASVFHIVINTNKHINNINNEYATNFYDGAIHIFKNNIMKYVEAYGGREEDNKNIKEFIDDMDVTVAREIGRKDSKYHLDITVKVKHRTKLRFKQKEIRTFFNNLNTYLYNQSHGDKGYHKCHIDIRGFADSSFYSEQYTKKDNNYETFKINI